MRHPGDTAHNVNPKIPLLMLVICALVCGGVVLAMLWYGSLVVVPSFTPYTLPSQGLQSTAVYLARNPDPLPEAPSFIYTEPPPGHTIHFWDKACVYLSVITFWERGEDPSELVTKLLKNTVITVDEVSMQPTSMQLGILVEDPQKGLGPGPHEFCFGVTLRPGAHLFQLVTEYPEDEIYSYSWSWVVGG